jgi:hypothetical protein
MERSGKCGLALVVFVAWTSWLQMCDLRVGARSQRYTYPDWHLPFLSTWPHSWWWRRLVCDGSREESRRRGLTGTFCGISLLVESQIGYELTNSTELRTPWEGASRSATHEYQNILGNPKVHYHVHNSLPLAHILSQMNPVYTTPFYFSKIHFNIIHPRTSRSS